MPNTIEIKGLDELIRRMQAYPDKLKQMTKLTMDAAMLALWENVPPYPPPPDDSTYVRTGTLGRTLGSSEAGSKGSNAPDIYEVKPMGSGYEGRFGTNLEYAPFVIGDETQSRRMSHWWKIGSIATRAAGKIESIFKTLGDNLASFLDGKG